MNFNPQVKRYHYLIPNKRFSINSLVKLAIKKVAFPNAF